MKTLFVVALLLCISIAYGLKCYKCSSTSSMDDCKSSRTEQDCTSSDSFSCGKMSMEYSGNKAYSKGCILKASCENKDLVLKLCKTFDGKCSLDCCDSDLCNGGTAPMVSVLLMMACALMALFR